MGFVAITIVLALATVIASRGTLTNLATVRFRLPGLVFAGFTIQAAALLGQTLLGELGGLFVAVTFVTYLLIAAFCLVNAHKCGMAAIAIGLAMNAIAIAANQGMPTRTPDGHTPIEQSAKHRPASDADHLPWLTDVIWLPPPVSSMISLGDVAISVGVCWVAYAVTRRRTDELDRAPTKQSA